MEAIMETIRCSNCKKNYKVNENKFELYFGYKTYDVPFKTCVQCRGRNKTKIRCEKCGLGILPDEKHMHQESVYCRSVAFDKAKQEQITTFID
eukprot:2324903-Amphidinium_carterae.1